MNSNVLTNILTDPDSAKSVTVNEMADLLASEIEVSPLGNRNVYFRPNMVVSPDDSITFPPTSGTTGDYLVGEQLVRGMWAGLSGVSDVVITDNGGISWATNSVELRYNIENTSLFTQGDETIHIVGGSGVKFSLKIADVSALTSTLLGNLLTVTIDFAIFAELSISSMRQIGLQDVVGVFSERNSEDVLSDMQTEILSGSVWIDETSSRSLTTVFTNTEDHAITIKVTLQSNSASAYNAQLFIDGDNIETGGNATAVSSSSRTVISVTVYPGETYQVLISNGTMEKWWEFK